MSDARLAQEGKHLPSSVRSKEGPRGGTGMEEKEEGCGRGQQRPRKEAGLRLGLRQGWSRLQGLGLGSWGGFTGYRVERREAGLPNQNT